MAEYLDDKFTCDKLEGGEDWMEWKYSMVLQLKARNLWGHVDGTAVLAGSPSGDVREKFELAAVRAHAFIVKALSKQVVSRVMSCDGPKAVWDKLLQEFEVKSVQNTMMLRSQVNRMKLNEGESLKSHIQGMKELYDRLAMLDDEISEKDQVINLLASLPTSYDALRSVLLCRGPSITWTEVNQALTLEEQQRELSARKLSEGKAEEKADVQGALRMEQTCHKCGQSEAEPTCYKCGQPGHFKRDCPQQYQRNRGRGRYNPGRGRGTGQQHGARAAESQGWDTYPQEYMFGANFNHTSERRTWIIDSGASRHMTYNKGQIYAYREFKEKEPVTLGDGNKVEAHGTGKVKLIMNSNQSITLQDVLYVPKLSCNLFSVGAAADKGITVDFGQDYCNFKMDNHVIASGTRNNKMYYLDHEAEMKPTLPVTSRA